MATGLPLIQKLETYYNAAAKKHPESAAHFSVDVDVLKVVFGAKADYDRTLLEAAAEELKTPQLQAFQSSPASMEVSAGARAIINTHTGPLF